MKKIMILLIALVTVEIQAMESTDPAEKLGANVVSVGQTFSGHTQRVSSVLFLDNNRIATGSFDGTVRIVNLNSGTAEVISNLGQIAALGSVPPNILYVASAQYNFPLFYDYNTKASLGNGRVAQGGHTQKITALAVLDPNSVATASQDGTVVILYKGGAAKPFNVKQPLNALVSVNANRILALSSKVNGIYMIDPTAYQTSYLPLPAGFTEPQSIAAVSPTRWAIGLADGRILILDSTTGRNEMRVLIGHNRPVYALSALNDTYLVSGSGDGTIKIWNAQTGKEILTLKPTNANAGTIYALATKWDEQTNQAKILAGAGDGSTWLWNLNWKASNKK